MLRKPAGPVVLLTLTAVFWAGAFVAGKIALVHLPPLTTAFWRFAVGTAVLVVVWHRREGLRFLPRSARAWVGLVAVGATGVFAYNWFFFKGLALTEAGAAALVITTNPALTAILSALFLGERLSRVKIFGFALAAAGALVVLSGGDLSRLAGLRLGAGAAYLGVAVCCWVAYVMVGKVVVGAVSPLTATTVGFLTGLPMLGVGATVESPLAVFFSAPWPAVSAVVFMGIFSSALAFLWFYEGVKALGASRASVFIYLVPGFALVFSYVLLGEAITLPKLAGGGLVVLGVVLTSA